MTITPPGIADLHRFAHSADPAQRAAAAAHPEAGIYLLNNLAYDRDEAVRTAARANPRFADRTGFTRADDTCNI